MEDVTISVTDMTGKQCFTRKQNTIAGQPITIQLSHLAAGTYVITMQHASSVQHKQLVLLAE
jgi:uncharacterized protein (DUF2141 family)